MNFGFDDFSRRNIPPIFWDFRASEFFSAELRVLFVFLQISCWRTVFRKILASLQIFSSYFGLEFFINVTFGSARLGLAWLGLRLRLKFESPNRTGLIAELVRRVVAPKLFPI